MCDAWRAAGSSTGTVALAPFVLDLVEPSLTRTMARISLALYHAERANPQDLSGALPDTPHKFGYKSLSSSVFPPARARLPARFRYGSEWSVSITPPKALPSKSSQAAVAPTRTSARLAEISPMAKHVIMP